MPWGEVSGIDDNDNDMSSKGYDGNSSPRRGGDVKVKSAPDYMSEAKYDFGKGYSRRKDAVRKMDSSFDEEYGRWKKRQRKGRDTAGYNANDQLRLITILWGATRTGKGLGAGGTARSVKRMRSSSLSIAKMTQTE